MTLESLYHFKEPKRLEVALTHKSYSNELRGDAAAVEAPEHNERFEFLGDAVLSLSLTTRLMREFATEPEGALSKRRASLVNEERLAALATKLGMQEKLRLGKGEVKTGGASKPRILACGLEALLGAIFLDGGYAEADRVVNQLFDPEIAQLRTSNLDFERDYKTRLQEWAHENRDATPTYMLLEELGLAHERSFRVAVLLGGGEIGRGEGKSKKAAEQDAARVALQAMDIMTGAGRADRILK